MSQLPPITESALCKIVKSIPVCKNSVPNNISVRMLINTFPRTGDVLTFIFNKILDEAFPRAWKLARVIAESNLNHFVVIGVAPLHVPSQGGATPEAK